jgi:predicted metal-binding protein
MSTVITVCDTCRRESRKEIRTEPSCGEMLLAEVKRAAVEAGLPVRHVSCLMGCERACNVAVSAPGKLTYVLGRFEPTAEAAAGIVAYAAGHRASETGAVPFRQWPQAVKGHFIARVPPV